jgi:hypothetical protein
MLLKEEPKLTEGFDDYLVKIIQSFGVLSRISGPCTRNPELRVRKANLSIE